MTRVQFLLLAFLFQGGLCLLGFGLAYWQGVELTWNWTLVSTSRGLLSTVPLTLLLWWALKSNWSPLRELRETLIHRFGPILKQCTFADLMFVSILAGVSEEVLFRGAIQNLLIEWGLIAAIVSTNVLFGLCHAASLIYFVYAFLAGCFLSWVAGIPDQNLSPAVMTHAVYDLIALGVIRHLADSPDASTRDDASDSTDDSAPDRENLQESSEL